MANTITGVLNDSGAAGLVEEYLNKRLLERRDWETVLLNNKWGRVDPIDQHQGQWSKFTRKDKLRRPQTMPSPGGAGSDPSSGAQLSIEQVKVPLEFIHEYIEVAKTLDWTSWLNIKQWINEDLPLALRRRQHELVQNAFLVGRMTPGLWSSTSDVATTAFDQTAQASPTIYGESFSFLSAPKYYANGKGSFADLDETDRLRWTDLSSLHVRLEMSGARKIDGGYVCVLSSAAWNDLLQDDDGGRQTAAIAGGFKEAIGGLKNQTVFKYRGWMFVIDDQPFTEDFGNEGKRANYGKIHSCLCFGAKSFTWLPMTGKRGALRKPPFKVQDITKTGYSFTVGYMIPYQVAIVNPDWCAVLKAPVSEHTPNNFNPATPNKQLEKFQNYV